MTTYFEKVLSSTKLPEGHLKNVYKLKLANKIANEVLDKREENRKNNFFNKNDDESILAGDIWGANEYLKSENKLSYAEDFIKNANNRLQMNKCIKTVTKKISYEQVDDVSDLHSYPVESLIKINLPEIDSNCKGLQVDNEEETKCESGVLEIPNQVPLQHEDYANVIMDKKIGKPFAALNQNELFPESPTNSDGPFKLTPKTHNDTDKALELITFSHTDVKYLKENFKDYSKSTNCAQSTESPCIITEQEIIDVCGITMDKIQTKNDVGPIEDEICVNTKVEIVSHESENLWTPSSEINEEDPIETIEVENLKQTLKLNLHLLEQKNINFRKTDFKSYYNTKELSLVSQSFNWSCMPEEIILKIFSFLKRDDLLQIMPTSLLFYRIANDSSLWKHMSFSNQMISSKLLSCLSKKSPTQVSLIKCKYDNITNNSLRKFFTSCKKSLKSLTLTQCQLPLLSGDNILLHVSSRCRDLEDVDISWSNTSDNGLIAVTDGSLAIKKLNINGNSGITNSSFQYFLKKHGALLEELHISGCFALKGNVLKNVSHCKQLTLLDISLLTKLETSQITQICLNLKCLKILNLRGIKSINDSCLHRIVMSCSELEEVTISKCTSVTNNGIIEIVTYLNKLSVFDISGCTAITDEGIVSLVMNCENLTKLNISGTAISYNSVECITENCFNTLVELKLNFCHNISNKCIEKLINFCFKLKLLQLYGCKTLTIKNMVYNNPYLKIES